MIEANQPHTKWPFIPTDIGGAGGSGAAVLGPGNPQ